MNAAGAAAQGLRFTGAYVGDACLGAAGWRIVASTFCDLDSGTHRSDAHRFYMRERMSIGAFHFIALL